MHCFTVTNIASSKFKLKSPAKCVIKIIAMTYSQSGSKKQAIYLSNAHGINSKLLVD